MMRVSGTNGRSVRLFLPDGTANGLTIAEVMNWTGKAVSAPRSRLSELIRRPESDRTGIYILLGPDPDQVAGLKAYIGEADCIGKRLRRHDDDEDKDFFERAAFIVSADENLTKAHVRFLESQIIRLTKEAGTVKLVNATDPDFARLPEADRSDMAFFLDQLKIVLPILGFDLFRSPGSLDNQTQSENPMFEFEQDNAKATARQLQDDFIVLGGSLARREETRSLPLSYKTLREQLRKDGRLVDEPDLALCRFTTDVAFTSPSAAASVVAAAARNGPVVWKLRGTGQAYKEWRAAQLSP